jgi:Sap, sulfolipid-1-addressing protein
VTDVFIVAVVSALDAGLLTAAVVLMGRPRSAQHLLAYLIGGMTLSIVFGLLIVLGLHGSNLLREPDRSTQAVIELAAGALMIAVAVAVAQVASSNGTRAALATATPRVRSWRASSRPP